MEKKKRSSKIDTRGAVVTGKNMVEAIQDMRFNAGDAQVFSIGTDLTIYNVTIQGFGTDHLVANGPTPATARKVEVLIPYADIRYFHRK